MGRHHPAGRRAGGRLGRCAGPVYCTLHGVPSEERARELAEVHRERVGKRVMAAVMPADDAVGDMAVRPG